VCGADVTTDVADLVKDIGFEYAMRSGSTLAVSDIAIPVESHKFSQKRREMLKASTALPPRSC
jgi:DNA-directed RNA polymerase subunit beta'